MLTPEPRFTVCALIEDLDEQGHVIDSHRDVITDLTDDQINEVVAACAKGWFEAGYRIQVGATPSPADAPGTLPLPWATATTDRAVSPSWPIHRSRVWAIPVDADPTGTEPPIVAAG